MVSMRLDGKLLGLETGQREDLSRQDGLLMKGWTGEAFWEGFVWAHNIV